jgi:hypothetical protein
VREAGADRVGAAARRCTPSLNARPSGSALWQSPRTRGWCTVSRQRRGVEVDPIDVGGGEAWGWDCGAGSGFGGEGWLPPDRLWGARSGGVEDAEEATT